MGRRGTPKPATVEQLLTIGQFAKRTGRASRTTYSLIKRLSKGMREAWIFRDGGRWKINITALRAAHPSLFQQRYVDRDEVDDFAEMARALFQRVQQLEKRVNAQGARIRSLEKAR